MEILNIALAKKIVQGQLELYKIEYAETNNDNYLQVMLDFRRTLEVLKSMDSVITKLSKENKELKAKLKIHE
ncbi:MAG: hypothetical protein GY793_01735 [Proteobacteria bacterium]|nr:hypothetical protein [Pseudomonadota bacterium]